MAKNIGRPNLKQQVAELEMQVKELQKELDNKQKSNQGRILNTLRRVMVVILVILTAVFINFSIVALYVKRNIVDTDVWVDKTTQVITTPSVSKDVSEGLAKAIFEKIDAKASIEQILPEKVAPLATPLTNTLQGYTAEQIDKILQSEQFIQFWQNASRSAHSGIVQSLEAANSGKSVPTDTLLYIQNEDLYLNFKPVLDNIKTKLSDSGLGFVNNINLKDVKKSIPIAHIDNFQAVLASFNLINKLAILLPILAILSAVCAIALSAGKRITIMAIAGVTMLLMMLNVQALYLVRYPFVNSITSSLASSSDSAAQEIFNILISDLIIFDRIVLGVGFLTIMLAYLTGPFKFAVWIRASIAKMFRGKMDYKFTRWLGKNAIPVISVSGLIAALLLVFPLMDGAAYAISILTADIIFTLIVLSFRQKK